MNTCPSCGSTLAPDGEQAHIVAGTMYELGSCINESCDRYGSTFSHSERPMTEAELNRYASIRSRLGIS